MNRLTVSELFYAEEPTLVRQNCSIANIFFTDDHIFLIETNNPHLIKILNMKDFKISQNFLIPENIAVGHIKSLTEVANFIVFALQGSDDLHYINSKRQFFKVSSHLQPINQVISYREGIASCSDDFTVRIWNVQKGQVIQSKTKHAYFGHTGKVNCFEKYEDFLVSGSSDQTVIFWRKDETHCIFKSNASIKKILPCVQSNQFAVFSQNGQISILNWSKIAKYRKAEVNRVIKYAPERIESLKNTFIHCNEVDDSFLWFNNGNQIVFVEINLGEIITKKQLCQEKKGKVINMKSIGRMLLYGKANDSMFLIRF